MTVWDFVDKGYLLETIYFHASRQYQGTMVFPIIKLKYGLARMNAGFYEGIWQHVYAAGNIMINRINTVVMRDCIIEVDEYRPITTKYRDFLISATHLSMYNVTLNLPNYTLFSLCNNEGNISLDTCYLNNNTVCIARHYTDFPPALSKNIDFNANVYNQSSRAFITGVRWNTGFTSTSMSIGNKGIASSLDIIKINW